MIITDYFKSEPDIIWDYAVQCGVKHGVIRLPETENFDITDASHWDFICDRFEQHGITPLVLEPIPNHLHDHIKAGDHERDGIRLALHPDDPPISKLGKVSRIFTSLDAVKRALAIGGSDHLGVTMCQATYHMMGEDIYQAIGELAANIFFIHFRNCRGNKYSFQETFHDNGELDMAGLIRHYCELGIDVPIRVDHVPMMAGEENTDPGYTGLGRLYAIGYLKGLLQMYDCNGRRDSVL